MKVPGDNRCACMKQRDEQGVDVETTLVRCPQNRGENLLRFSAAPGAIASTDFTRHDGGPERVFSAPVGRVDSRRVEQKGEERRPLDGEVRGESLHVGDPARMIENPIESLEQSPTHHSKAVGRHPSGEIPIAQRQRLLQHIADRDAEAAARVIDMQLPRPSEQMRQTRLMKRAVKAPIGRPSIADDDAREAPAEQARRFGIAAARLDPIDGRVRRRRRPQPMQTAGDFPPGFIGGHDRTPADPLAQRGIGRSRLSGGSVDSVHQPTARNHQAVLLLQQRGDLSEREPELLIEHDREGDRLGTQLRARGAQRVGSLQRMAPLHPASAHPAPANVNAKRPDDDARHREFFLILHRHSGRIDRSATVRAIVGQRRVVSLIDPAWSATTTLTAVSSAGFAPRPARMRCKSFCEGRGLPTRRAAGFIELPLQSLVITPQAVVLALQPLMLTLKALPLGFQLLALTTQRITLPFRALGAFAEIVDLGLLLIVVVAPTRLWHIDVMPEAQKLYKYEIWIDGQSARSFRTR